MKKLFHIVPVLLMLAVSTVAFGTNLNGYDESDSTDVVEEDVIVPPEYDGGLDEMFNFIKDNFQYPEDCEKRYVCGTIEIGFTIEKSGDMSSIYIIKGLEEAVDDELVRVFKAMPLWKPATRNGQPARYTVSMPVTLKISRKRNGDKSNWQL